MRAPRPSRFARALALGTLVLLAGCTQNGRFQAISMWNESRLKPLEPSPMAGQASSARDLPVGVVPRGQFPMEGTVATGRVGAQLATEIPFPVTRRVLERGQERFNVYCSPCHGRLGDGTGMVVKRGFPQPPDYAIRRLRDAPVGHFFDVMTNGYGVMYSYASRVQPTDRWAIAAYIRVLQRARPEVPEDVRPMPTGPTGVPSPGGPNGAPATGGAPGASAPSDSTGASGQTAG